jgi:hypothetical protein
MRRPSLARMIIMIIIVAAAQACALRYPPSSGQFTAERPHPTPAQLEELLEAPVEALNRRQMASPFEVRVTPRVLTAGQAVWLSCLIPQRYGPGTLSLEFEGRFSTTRAIDRIETRFLVERIPCGRWTASCEIVTTGGIRERREVTVEARGECNAGGGGER